MNIQNVSIGALFIFAVSSCAQNFESTYSYEPLKDVTFVLKTKKLSYHADIKSVFLYFELQIENKSSEDLYINVGNIQANLNGEPSMGTYYDSLASVIPKDEKLEKGINAWDLYFVYSENHKGKGIENFKVTDHGLRTI